MEGQQHINGLFSVTREAMPGTAGGLLVHFQRECWPKAKSKWTKEEADTHRETGQPIMENVDCIVYTLDGGLNITPPVRVKRIEDGAGYFDPDTGFMTDDVQRFPRQWAAYQAGLSGADQAIGWSLKQYFKSEPAKIEHYAYHKIYTVEQLAELPTTLAQRIGLGAVTDCNKAKADLDKARVAGPGIAQAEALHELSEQNKILQEQVAELMAAAKQRTANARNKKGNQDDGE